MLETHQNYVEDWSTWLTDNKTEYIMSNRREVELSTRKDNGNSGKYRFKRIWHFNN